MHPVAWGLTDPYFRSAVDSGLIKYSAKNRAPLGHCTKAGGKS